MKILIFTEILFGILIFVRIAGELRTKSLVQDDDVTKIVVGFLIWHAILATCLRGKELLFTFFYAISMLTFVFLPPALRILRQNQFADARILILNSLILKMKAGASLRPALAQTSNLYQPWLRAKLELMQEALEFSKENTNHITDSSAGEFLITLKECDKESHLAVQKLLIYRHKLDVEERFRKKVAQAMKSNRAQSVILTVLYVGLLCYVVGRYSFQEYRLLIVGSGCLFATGTVVLLLTGRKIKWKV